MLVTFGNFVIAAVKKYLPVGIHLVCQPPRRDDWLQRFLSPHRGIGQREAFSRFKRMGHYFAGKGSERNGEQGIGKEKCWDIADCFWQIKVSHPPRRIKGFEKTQSLDMIRMAMGNKKIAGSFFWKKLSGFPYTHPGIKKRVAPLPVLTSMQEVLPP